MKSKFILFTFLAGILTSEVFSMEDIFPPDVRDYDGKSRLGAWKLKDPDRYEKKNIPAGEPLYPYHAWIKHKDDLSPFHCIFYTHDKKIVSFVWEGEIPVDPTQYYFEDTPHAVVKSPYRHRETAEILGAKFDVWKGIKHWDPRPIDVPVNNFPVVFKFRNQENSEK